MYSAAEISPGKWRLYWVFDGNDDDDSQPFDHTRAREFDHEDFIVRVPAEFASALRAARVAMANRHMTP